jgi:Flp pilus assembly protein TadG
LVAIPFFILILSIFEMSLMFATASMLEGATGGASRMIRTGQIQQASADPGAQEQIFRDELCDRVSVLINCNDVQIQVVNMGSFGNFGNFAAQYDGNGDLDNTGFEVGGVNDVVLVRIGYRYKLMVPFVNLLLGANGTGTQYFMSTIVMQVEPYEFTGELS